MATSTALRVTAAAATATRGMPSATPMLDAQQGGDTRKELDEPDPREDQRGCFPARPFECCPGIVKTCLPRTVQVVQDATHLVIVLGLLSSVALLIMCIYLFCAGENKHSVGWHKEILIIVAVIPNVMYFCRMVNSYDEAIVVRERAIARKKQVLINEYETLVANIDDMLGKATQSSATLAEAGFESKRRDFIRFLTGIEDKARLFVISRDFDMPKMVREFKAFVSQWLKIFAECSVDPIHRPKYVLEVEELATLTSIAEVCSLVKERLKYAEVQFISQAHDKDMRLLRGFQQTHRRMSVAQGGLPIRGNDIEMCGVRSWSHNDLSPPAREIMQSSNKNAARTVQPASNNRPPPAGGSCFGLFPCTWFYFGLYGCSTGSVGSERNARTARPRAFECLCMRVVLLSKEHVGLIFGLFVCAALALLIVFGAAIEAFKETKVAYWPVLIPLAFYVWALVVLLIRFEQIDKCQRLEQEINQLIQDKEELAKRREDMVQFWSDMQNLTDIWVCRTTPRLDLMKEVHCALEDFRDAGDMLHALVRTNERVQAMENRLPELPLWRRNSIIDEDTKQKFARDLKAVFAHADQDLPKILCGVNALSEEDRLMSKFARGPALANGVA